MSLRIEMDKVRAVLLDDGWHIVHGISDDDGGVTSTFYLDSYEMVWIDDDGGVDLILGGGAYESCGVPALGFGFQECSAGDWICGPLTSIKAVRTS